MILAPALSAPSHADRAYVARLDAVQQQLASVAVAPLATADDRAGAMSTLATGASGLAAALAGAGALSTGIPSGATAWVHDAAALVADAVKELERGQVGLSFDASIVTADVQGAGRKLAAAQQLVLTPPTGDVYDGS